MSYASDDKKIKLSFVVIAIVLYVLNIILLYITDFSVTGRVSTAT